MLDGLSPTGFVLVNSARTWAQLGLTDLVDRLPPSHAVLVPASALALTHIGRAVPNAALLGGFAALSRPHVPRLGGRGDRGPLPVGRRGGQRLGAARAAFEHVLTAIGEVAHA